MKINNLIRIDCILRKLAFNIAYSIGVFWLIDRIDFLSIKEPYNKWYKKYKLNNLYSKVQRNTSGGGNYKNTFTNGK